jgi:hypothetical protein
MDGKFNTSPGKGSETLPQKQKLFWYKPKRIKRLFLDVMDD